MGPPTKGTKAYKTYLGTQATRKRTSRAAMKAAFAAASNKKACEKAVREATKDIVAALDAEVRQKNKYMRSESTYKQQAESIYDHGAILHSTCKADALDVQNKLCLKQQLLQSWSSVYH